MNRINSSDEAEQKILADIRQCLESVRQVVDEDVTSVNIGVNILSRLRKTASEDINQLQHEEMVLRAARTLQQDAEFSNPQIEWRWNPRQTGNISEPDLRANIGDKILLSAEITSSEEPKGQVAKRMLDTLIKLNDMPGRKFYFVKTDTMKKRALTKVQKEDFGIEVRKI